MLRVRAITWPLCKNLSDVFTSIILHIRAFNASCNVCCERVFFSPVCQRLAHFFHHPSDVHRNKPGLWVSLLLQMFVQEKRKTPSLGLGCTLTIEPLVLLGRTNSSSTHWFLVKCFFPPNYIFIVFFNNPARSNTILELRCHNAYYLHALANFSRNALRGDSLLTRCEGANWG